MKQTAFESFIDVYWHDDSLKHLTGMGVFEGPASPLLAYQEPHPETAVRILNIRSILERGPLAAAIRWHVGRHATDDELLLFHTRDYLTLIRRADREGPLRLDGAGTVAGPGTWAAAAAAAGTGLLAVEDVLNGIAQRAYALVRPPGHHAQRDRADGSCIFNNIALAAQYALRNGIRRIAVVDWDQHHGNGTQEGFYEDDRVLTVSLHMPHGPWGTNHPQLGLFEEVGAGRGVGYNLNIPLPYGSGDDRYRDVMQFAVGPAIDAFQPELLLVACGLDASQFDPNGRNLLTMNGFRSLGAIAREWADKHCQGRVVLFQEGGYAPTYTAFCAYAIVEGLLGLSDTLPDPAAYYDQTSLKSPSEGPAILSRWQDLVAATANLRRPDVTPQPMAALAGAPPGCLPAPTEHE